MSSSVEKIKERLNVVDVISSYIKVDKAGANFKAKCPFHNEKTPSFFISPDRGTYYCFGCGAKGDIFTFVQEFEGVEFFQALTLLAERAGIRLEMENAGNRERKDKLIRLMEDTAEFFVQNLKKNPQVTDYLHKRGLTDSSIEDWKIGYVPNEWRTLYNHLKQKKYSDSDMLAVGVIKPRESTDVSEPYYDTFRGRIMFPIFDSTGRTVAFSGRIFVEDEKAPKYLNSPDTSLFNKSEILYGLHKAKSGIRRLDYSILVEGQMDLVMSHQAGLTNTVASSGTALTVEHLMRLERLSPRIMFAFDSDSAGFNATKRSAEMALSRGMDVKIAILPKGEDPASLVAKDPDLWKEALRQSKHMIDFYIDTLIENTKDRRVLAREIKKEVLPFVQLVRSSVEQAHFIKTISEKTGIKEEALWDDLKSLTKRPIQSEAQAPPQFAKAASRKDSIERRILGVIYWQETLETKNLDPAKLRERLEQIMVGERLRTVEDILKEEQSALIFEAEQYYYQGSALEKDIDELFINLEEENLKEDLGRKMAELHKAELMKDGKKTEELLNLCQNIMNKLVALKHRNN